MKISKNTESITETLNSQLKNAGINTSAWGRLHTKTVEQLQKQIEDGETVLIKDKDGRLLRKVDWVSADVYYISKDGKRYRLKEEKIVLKNKYEFHRDLDGAVSEKIKKGGNPDSTLVRGINEELGISGTISSNYIGLTERTIDSPSYPGLLAKFTIYKYNVELNDEQFNPKGYIEKLPYQTSYFIWKEI